MSFNASKCSTIFITRKKNKTAYTYKLHNQELETNDQATYLGVELTSKLTWSAHINKTCAKGNRCLAFLRRNLNIKDRKIKEIAYKGLVRPVLEYCAPIWNPHQSKYIRMVEMVQRRAARLTLSRFHQTSSVTEMLQDLEWDSLQCRRKRSDLMMFYKIQHQMVAVHMPSIVSRPHRPRPNSPHHFRVPYCTTESYRNSYFPRAVREWNDLPSPLASMDSLPSFKTALSKHQFSKHPIQHIY